MQLSDLTSKTPEELNVMCAEALGWKRIVFKKDPASLWPDEIAVTTAKDGLMMPPSGVVSKRFPNYTGSWDAIMPEVRKIDYDQQETFTEHLIQVTMNSPHSTYCCCATASPTELTQALILTLTSQH